MERVTDAELMAEVRRGGREAFAELINRHKDTLVNYRGLEVADIFDLDALVLGEQQLQDTFGLDYRNGTKVRLLPFLGRVAFVTRSTGPWRGQFSVAQRALPGFVPEGMLSAGRRFGDRARVDVTVGYGGFGGARAGLAAQLRIGQHASFSLAVSQVPGLIDTRQRGAGASFGLNLGW